MERESKLYEQYLKEATYTWDIDSVDRSWFITPKGELWSDVSHRLMLKNRFQQKWDILKQRNIDDGEIDEILTNSLIQSSYVKIGELDDFYVIVYTLDNRSKDAIQGFFKSILKTRDVSSNSVTIHQKCNNETIKCIVKEISEDLLYNI